MRSLRLYASTSAVLDSHGNGQCSIGPESVGEVWNAGYKVSVRCSTNTSEAQCSTYAGAAASPKYFLDTTTWGSTGDSDADTPDIRVGSQVFAVWTGGDPGATAYLVVNGTRQVA